MCPVKGRAKASQKPLKKITRSTMHERPQQCSLVVAGLSPELPDPCGNPLSPFRMPPSVTGPMKLINSLCHLGGACCLQLRKSPNGPYPSPVTQIATVPVGQRIWGRGQVNGPIATLMDKVSRMSQASFGPLVLLSQSRQK